MPDQHREFFPLLPYLFVATTDEDGWPVATLLTGEPGFISSPDPTTLVVGATPREGEPGHDLFRAGRPFGALGLDTATLGPDEDRLLILRHTLMNPYLIDHENGISYIDRYFDFLGRRVRALHGAAGLPP